MRETILMGDDLVLQLEDGGCRPTINSSASWVRWLRENPASDPILWALWCKAKAWGELPTVWALRD
jgi:hypothetical protein